MESTRTTLNTDALVAALKAKIERENTLAYGGTREAYLTHYAAACALGHLLEAIEAGTYDAD